NVHLVMHGSSSVPKELQDIINQYGGRLKPTWGVPVEEIQLGIKNGGRKINVDTDNREAMKKVVAQRMTQFGQAGHAKDYAPIPMEEMAALYKREAVAV